MAPSQVLFGVDLAVPEGEVVTLLGRNGMGKTTTLRAIIRIAAAASMVEIHFTGERIDGLSTDAIARRGLALVPEGRQIFPNLSVSGEPGGVRRQPQRRARALDDRARVRAVPATGTARHRDGQPAVGRRTADARHRTRV